MSEDDRNTQIAGIENTKETFDTLFNEKKYNKLLEAGERRLSREATLNALFIHLYRNEPILHLPFRFLNALKDMDENFTIWRYRHSLMAHRMLGDKIGTGGSSGHRYLKMTAEKSRAFLDLFNLSTFLISQKELPKLPKELKQDLNFHISEKES